MTSCTGFHQWQANVRILDIRGIRTVPYVPRSHPFIERLIGTVRREGLDRLLFWTGADLERTLVDFQQVFQRASLACSARRRRRRTRPALGPVSKSIGGSRTVVGCITRRGPRDAVDRTAFTTAIYEFATQRRINNDACGILRSCLI